MSSEIRNEDSEVTPLQVDQVSDLVSENPYIPLEHKSRLEQFCDSFSKIVPVFRFDEWAVAFNGTASLNRELVHCTNKFEVDKLINILSGLFFDHEFALKIKNVLLIEEHNDDGVYWLVSFDGLHARAARTVRCSDKFESLKLIYILGAMKTLASPAEHTNGTPSQ